MNYTEHYERLIARAQARTQAPVGYRERHHILPRCMGGTNAPENLVNLSGEEHYVAHQLLAKIHPGVAGLICAAIVMARKCTGNKAYGWLRRRAAEESRVRNSGKSPSSETRAKLSAALLGKKRPAEVIARIAAGNRGKTRSADALKKMSEVSRGKKHSLETRAKMSVSHLTGGRVYVPHTPEAKEKIANALRGKKLSPEQRAKMSSSNIAAWARRRAVENRSSPWE